MKQHLEMSESLRMAICLTLAGGLQDAYSYICRGKVFVNAQTGNIVLMGKNLSEGNFRHGVDYLIPLMAFVLGVYLSVFIEEKGETRKLHWRQMVLLIQIVLTLMVGKMSEELNVLANALLSFSCAMQVNTFRYIHGLPYASTMCIGNMRSATDMLSRYHLTRNVQYRSKSIYYFSIIGVFALGAVLGAVLIKIFYLKTVWVCTALYCLSFFLFYRERKVESFW